MKWRVAIAAALLLTGCSAAVYTSAALDNASTFAAIRTSSAQRQVVEGNPIRKPLIAAGPVGAILITAALDFVVIKGCDALEHHGYVALSRGIRAGIIAGHALGIVNNTKIILDARHKR